MYSYDTERDPLVKNSQHTSKSCCCKCCTKKCWRIAGPLLATLAVGLFLTIFFLAPRIPELETAFVGVSGWNLRQGEGGSFFSMNMTFSATCKNRNYVPIVLPEVLIDVYHRNETYVGTVSKSDVVFPAQQDHTELLEFYIQNTSPQLVAALLLDAGTYPFTIQGHATVKYLFIQISLPINHNIEVQVRPPSEPPVALNPAAPPAALNPIAPPTAPPA